MKSLFRDANASVDLKIVDADTAAEEEAEGGKMTSIKLEIRGQEGQKQISMNTSAL